MRHRFAHGYARGFRQGFGFTLVEILVVLLVLAVLMALLLPAVLESRGQARRAVCLSHLRQLGIATHEFHAAHHHLPPGLEQTEAVAPPRYRGISLFCYLLPHFEEVTLARDWNYLEPMKNADGGSNSRAAAHLPVLQCPADQLGSQPLQVGSQYFGMTSYGGNGGTRSVDPLRATVDGLFFTTGPASEPQRGQLPVALSDITDGTTHTIMFGERSHDDPNFESFAAASWTDSLKTVGRWAALGGRKRIGDVTLSAFGGVNYRLPFPYEQRSDLVPPPETSRDFMEYEDRRLCSFGSGHRAGVNVVMADGSADFYQEAIDALVLQALCTRAQED